MYTYCVTFRIADRIIGGKSYDERRQQLIDNVYSEGQGYWEETTSFFLVQSNLKTYEFGAQAVRGLSAQDDIVVAFDPSDMSAAYFGPVKHVDVLAGFFKVIKKLP